MNKELKKHIDSSFKDLSKFLEGMDFRKALDTYWNVNYDDDDLFDGTYGYTEDGHGYFTFTVNNEGGKAELSKFITVYDNLDNLVCENYEIK